MINVGGVLTAACGGDDVRVTRSWFDSVMDESCATVEIRCDQSVPFRCAV